MPENIESKVKIPKTFEEKKQMYSKLIEGRYTEGNCKYDLETVEKAAADLANGKYKTPYLDNLSFVL